MEEPVNNESTDQVVQRSEAKEILGTEEKYRVAFEDEDVDSFQANVTPDQLDALADLGCYVEDSIEERRARHFVRQFPELEQAVRVTDTDELFEVRLTYVGATGEAVTNQLVEAFPRRFRTSVSLVFDPMAEDHDEPTVYIRPF